MDFSGLSGDYSYSDGETSDDLLTDSKNSSKAAQKLNLETSLKAQFDSQYNQLSMDGKPEFPFKYKDMFYNLEELSKLTISYKNFQTTPMTQVILCFADPSKFPKPESEYLKSQASTYAWAPLTQPLPHDFAVTAQDFYKTQYRALRSQIQFSPMNPGIHEKSLNLSNIRNSISLGRALFHFVGYGFPIPTQDALVIPGPKETIEFYPIRNLFETLQTPSFFIFDCNNAGGLIHTLTSTASQLDSNAKSQTGFLRTLSVSWNDFFAIGMTSMKESIPLDPRIPRDFLSACVLTPVATALLMHVLKNFRFTYKGDFKDFLTKSKNKSHQYLFNVLNAIEDSIAADVTPLDTFTKIFRGDRMINHLFHQFILAQYLISPYDVHPCSYPNIPDTSRHRLWQQWDMTASHFINSTVIDSPSFDNDFFGRVVNSINPFDTDIPHSLLAALSNVSPSDKSFGKAISILSSLCLTKHYKDSVKAVTVFNTVLNELNSDALDDQEFTHLCILVLHILRDDHSKTFGVRSEFDYRKLPQKLFDIKYSEKPRSLLAAIIAIFIPNVTIFKDIIETDSFWNDITNALKTAGPMLYCFLLIMLKKNYTQTHVNPLLFYERKTHLCVIEGLYQSSPQVRLASLSLLSSFLMENPAFDDHLILLAFPLIFDASYYIRYQLLLFYLPLLQGLTHSYKGASSFSELTSQVPFKVKFPVTLKDIVEAIDTKACTARDAMEFAVRYLMYDPHPSIREFATRIDEQFTKGEPPEELPTESDSEILFYTLYPQLFIQTKPKQTQFDPGYFGEASKISLQLRTKLQLGLEINLLTYDPHSLNSLAASNSDLFYFEDFFKDKSKHKASYPITSLSLLDDNALYLTTDGCAHVWNTKREHCSCEWRIDPDFTSQNKQLGVLGDNLYTIGSGSCVYSWDIRSQKLIGEFDTRQIHATAISLDEDPVVLVGFENGKLLAIDTRANEIVKHRQFRSEILSISGKKRKFVAAREGEWLEWSMKGDFVICRKEKPLKGFAVHDELPLALWVEEGSDCPYIEHLGIGTKQVIQVSSRQNVFAFHPLSPVLSFGSSSGELCSYNIVGQLENHREDRF